MAEQLLPDGTLDFSGGSNASLSPNSIKANQYFSGINISCQRTSITPRWGLVQQKLDFSTTGSYTRPTGMTVPFEEVFRGGKFQAFIPYSIGPDFFNIYIVSGFIFLINLLDFSVQVLNPNDSLNVYADRINWSNAGQYLVIFDFPNYPFILNGIQIHRADPALDEVPISVLGTYNQNRLCIANAGIDWTASDPAGSLASTTPPTNGPITFLEVLEASTGFTGDVYQVPTANKNNDHITAMGFLQVLDTSTGIGPLLVATNSAIYSYRTDLPRISWQGGVGGLVFGSVLLYSDGIVGQQAHANVGSDIIFKSSDGQIRALSMARNDQKLWGNNPISREVAQFLRLLDPTIDYVSVVAHFQNKIFITCNPHRVDCTSANGIIQTDYVNSGVVVIELDNTASLSNQSPPVWAGMWSGTGFLDLIDNNGLFYVAGKQRGRNEMYIWDPSKTYDIIDDKPRDIWAVIDTKEYIHGDMTVNKELHSLDLGLRFIEEKVKVQASYKPSTYNNYIPWKTLTFNAPVEQCSIPFNPNGFASHGVLNLNMGGVKQDICDPTNNVFTYVYKGAQIRLIIEGRNWEIEYIKVKAKVLPQTETDPYCGEKPGVPLPVACFDPWYIPDNGNC